MTKKSTNTKGSVGGEKVHRSNKPAMVAEERQPSFILGPILGARQIHRETLLSEIETQLEQSP